MTQYQVSADHVSPDFRFHSTLVEVRSTRSDEDCKSTVFYAKHPKLGCGKCYRTEQGAIYGLFSDHACNSITIEELRFQHDNHVRDYYDQPDDTSSKFTGERRAVVEAYAMMLNGFIHDDFGSSTDGAGYYCRVTFEQCPFIVCFVEDTQGFVTELSCSEYEAAHADYVERSEEEEEEEQDDLEPEETPAQRQLRQYKEKLFAISMELESLAEDAGWPDKSELLEVSAIIQEQCDKLDELLGDDQDD